MLDLSTADGQAVDLEVYGGGGVKGIHIKQASWKTEAACRGHGKKGWKVYWGQIVENTEFQEFITYHCMHLKNLIAN